MAKASTLSSHTAGTPKKMVKYIPAPYYFKLNSLNASVPICIVGLIANAIVLCLYCCKINKPKLGPYFLNVTFSNLIIIVCNLEVAAFYIGEMTTPLVLQRLLEMLHIFAYDTTLYIFTALTAERFLTVYFPVWWQHHRFNNFSVTMCAILWVVSGLESLMVYFSCYPRFKLINYDNTTCTIATIVEIIMEVIIFSPSLLFFTLAICIKRRRTQQNPLARLDITIVIIAILLLLLSIPVRLLHTISFWVQSMDWFLLTSTALLLDSCTSSSIPFVFLIVGSWKRQKAFEPFCMFLERALKDTEDTSEPTTADQEQA
ncbi:proto-oncogene Mas-like [Zootoca vivipara]|uniref:proto-oncogene Mas-like n=1 Tax=Zootoca vivipara TaxID=8524 RepID=UPI00159257F5|nr:proto-oncogene Mas-like [Zootoca vivipara]